VRTTTSSSTYLSGLRIALLAGVFLCSWPRLYAQSEDSIAAPESIEGATDIADTDEDEQTNEYFLRIPEYDSLRVNTRRVPDSIVNLLKGDKSYWYTQNESSKGNRKQQPRRIIKDGEQVERDSGSISSPPYKPFSSQQWFQTLMWIIIIGGFAGAVMWYLSNNNYGGLFRKKEKKLTGDDSGDEISENIFVINYQQEIDKAATQGNYRLAIRLMYLRILKSLSEKNIIQYKQDKTNFDYLMQLQPTAYYKDFFRVTRHYEYSWYGEFNVSPDAYAIIRHEFDQFGKITG
jgi:hypothetical protein